VQVLRIAGLVAAAAALAGAALPGTTTRVSVDGNGAEADGESFGPSASADGRFIAFLSRATNLVPGDANGVHDIFVHDRTTGETTRASVSSGGVEGNGDSADPKITPDGRYVVFVSSATNFWFEDFNNAPDIFVHDRATGETSRVSISSDGAPTDGESGDPTISADGRYVAFSSVATNLVPGDTNRRKDVFVHDRQTAVTSRVSVSSTGGQANGASRESDVSDDGHLVAFSSTAANLVPGDTNGRSDAFVHDLLTDATMRVSVTSTGAQANGKSDRPVLSSDGTIVAFDSDANDLVAADTNRQPDVFVHDRATGATTRVSVTSAGNQGKKRSFNPDLSGDARLVSFNSNARLDSIDSNGRGDVYVHDRATARTTIESVSSSGAIGNDQSIRSSLSTDGSVLSFSSIATNLVPEDDNFGRDIFVHEHVTG
jgi:Tol biopolymer transport system component